jgi:Dehydrogenases with different specificities (related to short-chain alcohol dehydrogenases)
MKTTLITGAGRGIGLEFCRQYAADGWRVLACSRHPEKSDALNKLAAQYPGLIKMYALDVADHALIERLGELLENESAEELLMEPLAIRLGEQTTLAKSLVMAGHPIDLLINNAGIYPDSDKRGFGHTDYAEWIQAFRINTMAPLKMAETFAAQIARSKQKTIVTITSKMGSIADNGGGGSYLYRSSKAAVNMVMKSLAVDLMPSGIIAVVLHPGWVQTDMGGPNALISAEQSVSGMRQVISRLTLADSGKFFGYDGQVIPW